MQILTFTIPPSRLRRATSLCTREAFFFARKCALTHHRKWWCHRKSRYGYKSISAILLSFRTQGKLYCTFCTFYCIFAYFLRENKKIPHENFSRGICNLKLSESSFKTKNNHKIGKSPPPVLWFFVTFFVLCNFAKKTLQNSTIIYVFSLTNLSLLC